MTKGERAKELFLGGKNCSVAVVLAFEEELGLQQETLKKLFLGFGGGLSRQRLVCGAVSGMTAVISALCSDGENKAETYAIIQKACEDFKSEVGSVLCGELLDGTAAKNTSPIPDARTPEYYKKRPCAELCALAADVAEKYTRK